MCEMYKLFWHQVYSFATHLDQIQDGMQWPQPTCWLTPFISGPGPGQSSQHIDSRASAVQPVCFLLQFITH